jgi:AAHS family 4-hydroxybenzoate transporter-like MFS transporter
MTGETRVDVGHVLDDGRWGTYQMWLVFLTALGIIFDGIDNQLLGIAIPSMMEEWSVARTAFSPVVSLGFVGMLVGGAAAGLAGDRFGRRTALVGCMFTFGVTTMGAAIVGGPTELGLLRLLAGIGLGGAIPNAATLSAEYVPVRQRPFAVTLTIVCVPLGGMVAGLIAVPALPSLGWRALFALGGVVPVVAAVIYLRLLPESPRFLARHPGRWPELETSLRRMGRDVPMNAVFEEGREASGGRASVGLLFGEDLRRDTMGLWASFFSCLLAVYLAFSWLPSILTSAGLGPSIASAGITIFNLGGVIGAVAGGKLIARLGSRSTMLSMTAAGIVASMALSAMDIAAGASVAPIMVLLMIVGGLINAVQTTMYALAAHVYPTPVRATGVGSAAAFGRGGAILTGYAGPWALAYAGSASFFVLVASALFVTFLGLALVRRHVPAGARA